MMNQLYRLEIACRLENNGKYRRIWSLLRAPDLGNASGIRFRRRLKMNGNAASYSDQEGVVAVIRAKAS